MLNKRQQFGKKNEALAAKTLKKMGYKIIEQNYQNKIGEIDIIAKDGKTIVFVEVKARKSGKYGNPKSAVNHAKQRKISMVALYYLKANEKMHSKARFDVVAIKAGEGVHEIEVIKNAFDLAYP
jgi:putative endonuclease